MERTCFKKVAVCISVIGGVAGMAALALASGGGEGAHGGGGIPPHKWWDLLYRTLNFACLCVDVYASEGGVGGGSGHQLYRPGHRANQTGTSVDENVAYGQCPACRTALQIRIVREAQMRFHHAYAKISRSRLSFEGVELLAGNIGIGYAIGSVDASRNSLDAIG